MGVARELIVNGEHVPALSGRTTEDIDPCTGEVFATVAAGGPEDVARAVDAAVAKGATVRAGGQRLKTGIVHVDDRSVADEPRAPFGGIQESGYGKFGGMACVESFGERRWITVQEEGHARYPF